MEPALKSGPMSPEISIVVPLRNEAPVVDQLAAAVREVMQGTRRSWELVCVDDGSTDDTAALLEQLAEADARIVVLQLSRNFGKESAMAAGMEVARGAAVVLMDGDLQHPPALIPELIRHWDEGFDIVNAVKATRGAESLGHRLGASVFNVLIGRAIGDNLRAQSDFKLLDRQVVQVLRECQETNRFLRGLVAWVGFRVARVPFDVSRRAGGESRWKTADLMRYSLRSLIAFSSFPLRAIAWLGFLTTGFGILLAIDTLYNYLRGVAVTGFTTTILIVIIMGGAILFSLGVVAIYLSVIYDELKGRPSYVIRNRRRDQRREDASP